MERTSSFLTFFLLAAQASPQQRAESGERSQSSLGGPGEGLGRSRGVGALVAVAGRGGEELFPPFCRVADSRVRIFHSFENEMSDAIGALVVLPSKQQQQHQHQHQQQQQQQIIRVAHLVRESRSQSTTAPLSITRSFSCPLIFTAACATRNALLLPLWSSGDHLLSTALGHIIILLTNH